MTTIRELAGGYLDLAGYLSGTVRVESFAGRDRNRVPRWNMRCERCFSSWVAPHQQLTQGDGFRCRNVACQLGRVEARDIVSPTPKPDHETDNVPKPVATPAPAPKPKPAPAPDPLLGDYNRFVAAQRHWGNPPCNFQSFKSYKEFYPEDFKATMQNVAALEHEQAEKIRLEKAGQELERQFNEEFMRKYDLEVAVNITGGK